MVAAQAALPKHVLATAQEALEAVGWDPVPNPVAVAQVVNGGIGQVTGDFARLTPAVQSRIIGDIATSIAVGEHPRDLARRLSESLEPAFMGGQSRSVTVARTVTARAYDQASLFTYQQAAAKGVVYGWRWVARPGACEVCRTLHGTVFPPGEDTYRHPNCTCVTVPVLFDEPAAQTPYGDRFDPFDDADTPIVRRTSQSGWTSWAKAPKNAAARTAADLPEQDLFVARRWQYGVNDDDPTTIRQAMDWMVESDPTDRAVTLWAQSYDVQASTKRVISNIERGVDPFDGVDFDSWGMRAIMQGSETPTGATPYGIAQMKADLLNTARVISGDVQSARPVDVLFRGMRVDDPAALFRVGEQFDASLVSATPVENVARLYTRPDAMYRPGSQPVLMRIEGAVARDIDAGRMVGGQAGSQEHLIADRLVILSVDEVDGMWIVVAAHA